MNCLIQHAGEWLCFRDPVEILTARAQKEVFQALEKIEKSALWAAGFVSYEAAGAFDDALKTHTAGSLPLLQFGLFEPPKGWTSLLDVRGRLGRPSLPNYELGEWTPSVSRGEYSAAIASIKEHIAAGNTYQVNHTFRLNADFEGDPFAFFCDLTAAQQSGCGAFIETDDFAICSASPELFFELKDGVITARPMKGTRKRGLTFSNDWKQRGALLNSEKDRAENIMIVDMIRNDIGRVAMPGAVETLSRFDVEKYPTVWQMTSTVRGKIQTEGRKEREDDGSLSELRDLPVRKILDALFPCASITGAPKAKTMEIIQSLETSPRGVYTGSIGFIDPDGTAQLNVAIRTAVVDRNNGLVEYGIGGGIVWDSDADAEYEEALSKAAILAKKMPEFQLLETMLWEDGEIFLLERHLKRLRESAQYFDFQIDPEKIRDHLRNLRFEEPTRLRLLLSKDGSFEVGRAVLSAPQTAEDSRPYQLAVAKQSIESNDVFLYHKTTNRAVYESAFAKAAADKEANDVLLYNERGEVTESCIANVVVELDGKKVTPPVECGLLAGTFRDELLERGEIEEGILTLDDLKRADAIWLVNSVRKWRQTELLPAG